MNKDVIYIEPEDDITDIVGKVTGAKEKIVALVPPKKTNVLRSSVNIKLIAKAGASAGKSVVLVTTDPAVVKLAAAVKLPVTKSLQSAPVIPVVTDEAEASEAATNTETSAIMEESVEETEIRINDNSASELAVSEETQEDTDESTTETESADGQKESKEDASAKSKKKKAKVEGKNAFITWILNHKGIVIGCGIGAVILILVAIWAFVIAPAATITVDLRTTTSNFSENATFTTVLAEENASQGRFYLTEKKLESKSEVDFEATGKKNIGEKASGEVIVYAYFRTEGAVAINTGTVFTYDELNFISQKEVTLAMTSTTTCENTNPTELALSGCLVSARVPVVAENPGASYNVGASDRGWSTVSDVSVYSDKAMSGGTDQTVTVVQQSDIDAAKEKLKNKSESQYKETLLESIPEGNLAIDGSFVQTVSDAVSSPAVGEEVKDGANAKLTVITTNTIFYVDLTKIKEFIEEKAKLAENYKIYEVANPFVENFVKGEKDYTGKIKTSYISGPEVTENSVIEVVKGKGVGTAQHDLSEINGIGKIRIDTSFPWVSSIPNDPEKITVIINVEE